MISLIIFSYNRPSQLDLLLQSINKNSNGLFSSIDVLYKYDNEQYQKGYQLCNHYHQNLPVDFWTESDFRKDLLTILLYRNQSKYICFCVDDNILYRPITISQSDVDDVFGQILDTLSLRLGRNVYLDDISANKKAIIPSKIGQYKNFYLWNSLTVPLSSNYGYPLSVDGHIFRTIKIIKTITNIEFTNPNFLEGNLQQYKNDFPYMACQELSCIVNSPNNRVQNTFTNKFGLNYFLDPQELNNKFLEGYRFKLDQIDFSNICGCHQELNLQIFKQ